MCFLNILPFKYSMISQIGYPIDEVDFGTTELDEETLGAAINDLFGISFG